MIKVMIVEDDPINVELLEELVKTYFLAIENDSFSIDIANDGTEAVNLFTKNRHDIIFMDALMPNMDGFEATRSIRLCENINKDKEPIIIMVTSLDDKKSIDKGFLSGINWYISKPYNMDELEIILNDIVVQKPYLQGHKKSIVDKKVTAKEFMDNFFLEFSVHRLEKFNEQLVALLNKFDQTDDKVCLKEMAKIFGDYSRFLETAKEFKKISLILFDLSEIFKEIDNIENRDFFVDFMYKLLEDLDSFCKNIFLDQIAIDIHYLDESLISSILQLKAFLKPSMMFEEEEVEFF